MSVISFTYLSGVTFTASYGAVGGSTSTPTITEGTPSGANAFQIYAEGNLAGSLSTGGLVATEVEEAVL